MALDCRMTIDRVQECCSRTVADFEAPADSPSLSGQRRLGHGVAGRTQPLDDAVASLVAGFDRNRPPTVRGHFQGIGTPRAESDRLRPGADGVHELFHG